MPTNSVKRILSTAGNTCCLLAALGLALCATGGELGSGATNAEPNTELRDFSLEFKGTLRLQAPKSWVNSQMSRQVQLGTEMDQVLFREPKADDFAVVISVIHMQEDKAKQLDPTEALLQAAKKEMGSAMETKPEVHLFNGPEVTAAYMSMTDATVSATAPKAGEFRFLTLGYAKLGNLVIAFRMVSNRPGEAERLALIEMIKTAHFIPRKLPN